MISYLVIGFIISLLSLVRLIYWAFSELKIEDTESEYKWNTETRIYEYTKVSLISYIKLLLLRKEYILNSILITFVTIIIVFVTPILFYVSVYIWPILLVPIALYQIRKRLIKQQNKKE